MYTKKDLEVKFKLSDNTVYKTLQACGLNTGKQKYSSEEIDNYFAPARLMLEEGKTQKQVKDYFDLKSRQEFRQEYAECQEEFEPEEYACNQTIDATDTISNVVAETVSQMVEQSVKDIAPFIPALVVQTINTQLNSDEIMQAFEQMRCEIQKRKGSGAAFLLRKMQTAQAQVNQKPLMPPAQEHRQLPQVSPSNSTDS
jgi:cell fate (sporulation/competence/biofilm development) regulator YlbF (YheA/YmcA/DUF963 family)